VFPEGMRVIKPGGHYTFVGLVHPNSELDVTAEQIIRKCLTFRGMTNDYWHIMANGLKTRAQILSDGKFTDFLFPEIKE
jgi:threonine dehydrogenase-like Zn-dependent dehydrogenase